MLDHLLVYSKPELLEKTISFYLAVLGPLGYKKFASYMDDAVVGLRDEGDHADFWITSTAVRPEQNIQPGYAHFAFGTKERKLVDECYAKGLAAGGKDNGAPGLRPMYAANYYAAFIYDPCGNCMEIVSRGPQPADA